MPSGNALIGSMLRCVLPCPVGRRCRPSRSMRLSRAAAEITVFDPHPGFSAAAAKYSPAACWRLGASASADEAVLREAGCARPLEAMLPGVVKRNGTLNDRAGTEGTAVVVTTQPPAVGSWRH